MSNITNVETMIFVTYRIARIQAEFKDSLDQHLLDAVWGDSGRADEDIRVIVNSWQGEAWISEIRYQFGENYDEFLAEEIGELIDKEISVWSAKNNLHDIICA